MPLVKDIKVSEPMAVMAPYIDEITDAVNRVIASGLYVGGKEVSDFETEFASYLDVHYAISTGSGTDALQLALRALDVRAGDYVATVSHTAVATVAAIEMLGAIPVFIDIDSETFTMDVSCLQETLELHRTDPALKPIKGIIPVHIYGHPANMPVIMPLAATYGAWVIEDCAQSHGAEIDGRKCGTWGHAAAFSFYPTKNLGCLGDGGAMVTNNVAVYEKAVLLKEYGWKERYISVIPGINTRLDSIQAAVLRVKLKYLDQENDRRIKNAVQLSKGLATTKLITPGIVTGWRHVFHQYTVRSENRAIWIQKLQEEGIATSILYPMPVHLQPAYHHRIKLHRTLEVTERICNEIFCLPVHPALQEEDIAGIIASIQRPAFSF